MSRAAPYCYWSNAIAELIGIFLILAALVRYPSWSNTRVLGRWSETHFSIIVLFVVIFSGILFRLWKERSSGIPLSALSPVVR
jgi:hypothetical protein